MSATGTDRGFIASSAMPPGTSTRSPCGWPSSSLRSSPQAPPSQPRSGVVEPGARARREPQEPGAGETLVALLVSNPIRVKWNGSRRGAGTIRCRPRWGLEKWHAHKIPAARAPGFTIPPHSGGSETKSLSGSFSTAPQSPPRTFFSIGCLLRGDVGRPGTGLSAQTWSVNVHSLP